MTKKDRIMRVDEDFATEMDSIKVERIKNGKDKKLKSDKRLTLAVVKHNLWEKIKGDITNNSLKDSKGGQIGKNLIVFIILAFVTLTIFGMFTWVTGNLSDSFIGIPDTPGQSVNLSEAGANTFGKLNSAMLPSFKILAFVVLFSMIIGMLIVEFYTKKHPAFFIIDFFLVIFAFIISVFMSNRYVELLSGQPFSSALQSFTGASSIMKFLPRWVTVVGVFGMILSFIGIIRRRGTEEFQ